MSCEVHVKSNSMQFCLRSIEQAQHWATELRSAARVRHLHWSSADEQLASPLTQLLCVTTQLWCKPGVCLLQFWAWLVYQHEMSGPPPCALPQTIAAGQRLTETQHNSDSAGMHSASLHSKSIPWAAPHHRICKSDWLACSLQSLCFAVR